LETLSSTAKIQSLTILEKTGVFEGCAILNITREMIFFKIRSINERRLGGAKFWALVADDYYNYRWSFILKTSLF
jgi:hypothetical protein